MNYHRKSTKHILRKPLLPHRCTLALEYVSEDGSAAPVAFVVAGTVALLTAFSYWRLSLRYPSDGGTVVVGVTAAGVPDGTVAVRNAAGGLSRVGVGPVAVSVVVDCVSEFVGCGVEVGVVGFAFGVVVFAVVVVVGIDAVGKVVAVEVGELVDDGAIAVAVDGVA